MNIDSKTFVVAISDTEEAEHVFRWVVKSLLGEKDLLKLVYAQNITGKRLRTDVVPLIESERSARFTRSLNVDMLSDQSFALSNHYSKLCHELDVKEYTIEALLEDIGVGKALCDYVEKLELLPGVNSDSIMLVLGQKRNPVPKGFFSRAENVWSYCVKNCPCPVVVVKEHFIPSDDEKRVMKKIQALRKPKVQAPPPLQIEHMESEEPEEHKELEERESL